MSVANVAVALGAILAFVGIVSGITSLFILLRDRAGTRRDTERKQTVESGSLALREMELALTELARMNRRIAEELQACLEAKAKLQKCQDG